MVNIYAEVNILGIFLSLYHIQIHLKTLIVTRARLVYFLFAWFNSGAEKPLFEMDPTDKEKNKKKQLIRNPSNYKLCEPFHFFPF